MNITVNDLHRWAAEKVGDDSEAVWNFLAKVTLAPTKPHWDYWCDPLNVDTFAETGMDGAHFGQFDADDGKCPVVLIAPDSFDRCCTILGESFHEFLCLGCGVGYGLLVELAARPVWTTEQIQISRPSSDPEERQILQNLRIQFSLSPWPNVGARLFELQEQYLDQLDMPE